MLPSFVFGVDGRVQGNGPRTELPLTRYQCSIHYESSRMTHGARKWRWAPQTTRNTPKRIQSEYNETEPESFHIHVFKKIAKLFALSVENAEEAVHPG